MIGFHQGNQEFQKGVSNNRMNIALTTMKFNIFLPNNHHKKIAAK